MPTYRFSMKSEEQEGAGQSNNVYVDLASDADAAIFADNLEQLFSADTVTVDALVTSNYTLPYPAGHDNTWRYVVRAGPFVSVQTERLNNVVDAASASAFASAYKALTGVGWVQPSFVATQPALVPITAVDIYTFPLGPSH